MTEKKDHTEQASAPETSEKGAGQNRVSSFANETRSLVADIKEWVDLRVRLVQLEIEERIETLANQLISLVAVTVLGLFAIMFLLMGLAVWIGNLLESPALGYVIVGSALALITTVIHLVRPRIMKSEVSEDRLALESKEENKKLISGASEEEKEDAALTGEKK